MNTTVCNSLSDTFWQQDPELAARMTHIRQLFGDDLAVEAFLGRGAMGVVYRVRYRGKTLALKVLLSELVNRPGSLRRFLLEGRILAKLDHPHVLRIHQLGQEPNFPFLLCDYAGGGTLADLGAKVRLPWQRALRLAGQVLSGLAAAHEHGIIHRDVKPANILLVSGERCLVADFGIAKCEELDSHQTTTGFVVGTPAYMAPELLLGARPSRQSDVYSVGTMLYEMLSGQLPFPVDEHWQFTERLRKPAPSLSSKLPGAPAFLDRLLAWVLANDPRQRPECALALSREIQQLLSGRGRGFSMKDRSAPTVWTPTVGDRKGTIVTPRFERRIPLHASVNIYSNWWKIICSCIIALLLFSRIPRGSTARPLRASHAPCTSGLTADERSVVDKLSLCSKGNPLTRAILDGLEVRGVDRKATVLLRSLKVGGASRDDVLAALSVLEHPLAVPALIEILEGAPVSDSGERLRAAQRLLRIVSSPSTPPATNCPLLDTEVLSGKLCALLENCALVGRREAPVVVQAAIKTLGWLADPTVTCVQAIEQAPELAGWLSGPDATQVVDETLSRLDNAPARQALATRRKVRAASVTPR